MYYRALLRATILCGHYIVTMTWLGKDKYYMMIGTHFPAGIFAALVAFVDQTRSMSAPEAPCTIKEP